MFGKITLKELIKLLNYPSFNNDSYYFHLKRDFNILACICSYSDVSQISDVKQSKKKEALMFVTDTDNPRLGFTDLMSNILLENDNTVVQVFQNFIQKKLFTQSRFIRFEQIASFQLKEDPTTLHIVYQFFGKQKKIHVKLRQKQAEKWRDILQEIKNKKSINFSDKYLENLRPSTQKEQLQPITIKIWNKLTSQFAKKQQDVQKLSFLNKADKLVPFQFKKRIIEAIDQKRYNCIQLAQALVEMFKNQIQKINVQLETKQNLLIKFHQDLQLKKCQLIENQTTLMQYKLKSQNQKHSYENKIDELQKNQKQLRKAKEQLSKQIIQLKSQKDHVLKQKDSLEQAIKKNEIQYKEIVANVTTLKQALKKKQNEASQLSSKIRNKQTDYSQLLNLNNILGQNKQIYQGQKKQFQERIGNLETQRADIMQQKLSLLQYIKQLKVKLASSNQQNQKLKAQFAAFNLQNKQLNKKLATSNQQNKKLFEQISKIEQENKSLKQNLFTCKQNISTYQQNLSSCQQNLNQTISELQRQRSIFEQIKKQASQQHLLHIFGGNVLQNALNQKSFLKNEIEKCTGKILSFTRLIFKNDPCNPTSFHHYVDEHPNICAVIKLKNGRYIAGFSVSPLSDKTVANQGGIICSLTEKKTYKLCEGKRSVTYDKFFLIFGNSELRLKQGEVKFFSNFGIANSFYDSNGDKYTVLNGVGTQREVIYENFEVFEVFFK